MHVTKYLLKRGDMVCGIDNINPYYDVSLKQARLNQIVKIKNFKFYNTDICNTNELSKIFDEFSPDKVIHLAAQPGVRYSLIDPQSYVKTNITGFLNILEASQKHKIKHLVYASSSSVYGLNSNIPYLESHNTNHPTNLYGATKKANELMAHSYSHLYGLPSTGLRFFSVYGPWGRPDMALFKFTKAILENKEIDVYNDGVMKRDFTFIDDLVESIISISNVPPLSNANFNSFLPSPDSSSAPYRIFNIGNGNPVNLIDFINIIEEELGIKARINFKPMQAGDMHITYSNNESITKLIRTHSNTDLKSGVNKFINWYKKYYEYKF